MKVNLCDNKYLYQLSYMSMLQFLKHVCIPLCAVVVFMFSTAESCNGNSSGKDDRPSMNSVYTETWDIPLDPVFLRYDMSKFINDCQRYGNLYPASDMQELADYNDVMEASSWLNFNTLFYNAEKYSGPGPEAKFVFIDPDCKGDISIVYNRFDDKLCNHNVISGAPKIRKTHVVDFSAHTIKTSQNGICVKWNRRLDMPGQGTYMNIDLWGKVEYPTYLFSSGVRGGNRVAIRMEGDKVVLVDNTISKDDLAPGAYTPTLVNEKPIISNTLQKDVCVGGRVDETMKWDAPTIIELESR